MPITCTLCVIHWPRNWKLSMAGTTTVGVIPTMSSPTILRISSMWRAGSRKPSRLRDSNTTSERIPWIRFLISVVKPCITLLTTIIVATPSITLMIDASAM